MEKNNQANQLVSVDTTDVESIKGKQSGNTSFF
jgi:hypothetical protein